MSGFSPRDGVLLCDGVSLADVAERFGTPLYVYSRGLLEQAYAGYERALASVPHRVCYALKANASGALLRVLAGLGAGADVVSGMELRAALRAGFPPERIAFSGVGKTDAELELAIETGTAVNVESEHELLRLSALAQGRGVRARVGLRVNPGIDPGSHPYVATGARESKFGVDAADAQELMLRASRLPGLELEGLQCHVGSQITDLGPLEQAARELARLSRALLASGVPLRTLDVGGGLGVDYDGTGAPTPDRLAERILPQLTGLGLTLVVEPGRSLLARTGALVTRVVRTKRNGGKTFVVVDAAMNDLVRPSLYDAYHRVELVAPRGRATATVDVVGPVCEAGDFLARDRELEAVEAGDLLVVRDVGAYGFSMASTYNMRPRPAEVLVEHGAARLIRRRESFEDLVGTEV